ncbi:flagellar basal body L-ring protein FlgH [Hyphobacterium sp. HN65]|uniref:Flagellar L-ring protein n=1 Tax=Hyphobacterium lacteum TaxID=3116575 RepID=A0ABU7LQJ8_9PROT|nr:flagellar basal body L-ring protein FlgH [Hyphobacterium sp. HN65]MEE2526190.1 flagellar basal body L-ring protein FlgH [Hyphobacterium sp. HN65]
MIRKIALVAAALSLGACSTAQRLSEVGSTPALSPIENPALYATGPNARSASHNAQGQYGGQSGGQYTPPPSHGGQSTAQTPQYAPPQYAANTHAPAYDNSPTNSLWTAGRQTFFGDPRAANPGDILTVNINIADSANVQNSTNRARTSAEDSDLTNFLGGEAALSSFFNDAIDPTSIASFGSSGSHTGSGAVTRAETINLSIAAVVTDRMPNGNLAIAGRQEVRINNEIRELLVSGVVRPQDIASDNTIRHTQIAEARISYGGRGHISDVQRPRMGQEVFDILWPF